MGKRGSGNRGQVTIFVIIALVVVVGIALYFIFLNGSFSRVNSPTFDPVENQLLNCISTDTAIGIQTAEVHAGYIYPPAFISGSAYMPYSSQLYFAGTMIPYWRSVSGNNLPINQVPTLNDIENQIADYINSQIKNCNFNSFYQEGYSISTGTPQAKVTIENNDVKVTLSMDLSMKKGNETSVISSHDVQVNSQLGNLYNDAITFYNTENSKMFLENYSVDVLNLYAPVDGFDLSCSPETWNANTIFSTLKNATQDNLMSIKNNGPSNDYFALHLPIDSSVRIINSASWPSTYEVEPGNSPIMVANPVGNQQGLGILGFCYVPYHFVYNMRYPVLVQLTRNNENFQFPLSIDIESNVPAGTNITGSSSSSNLTVDLCNGPYSNVTLNLVGSDGNPVNGNVTYNCFDSSCNLGETVNGTLTAPFPQCVNGNIVVNSQGYEENSQIFTSLNGGSITTMMNKIYQKTVFLNMTNSKPDDQAIITFSSNTSQSQTIMYPGQNQVNLSSGNYNIQVYIFDNSSNLSFNATTIQTCVNAPSGVLGIFGITSQQCSSTSIPAQNISSVLVGGGNANLFLSENDLQKNNKIEIDTKLFNTPTSLQELQIAYTLVEGQSIGVKLS